MLFSTIDMDILRLLRWCRYIRANDLARTFSDAEVRNLAALALIKLHKPSGAYVLTVKGNRLLDDAMAGLPPATPPAYKSADTLRRLHLSEILCMAYTAGLQVFTTATVELANDLSLFLPAIARGRGTNPWGSTRVAAIVHLGDLLCAVHYVCPGIGRIALNDELAAFHNNTAHLPEMQRAVVFSGASYTDILAELESTETASDAKLTSYGDAYRLLKLPVFLVPCDAAGTLQLRSLSVPDYRRKLTQAALKARYAPPPKSFPLCDAWFHGVPFLMAADMDLRRIDASIDAARAQGFTQISLAALPSQCEAVLYPRYRDTVKACVFALTNATLTQVLDSSLPPYAPPDLPFYTSEGSVVDVPPIQVS